MRSKVPRELRIISGSWRGRRFRFPDHVDIRPTPDRVRETLFNWLATSIVGARCVDAFAGSGALGLEALSRGAASVHFLEREPRAAFALQERLQEWHAIGASVVRGDSLSWLRGQRPVDLPPFDLAFLDPPFAQDLVRPTWQALIDGDWLAPGARVYAESSADAVALEPPVGWKLVRSKIAGDVGYHLAEQGDS